MWYIPRILWLLLFDIQCPKLKAQIKYTENFWLMIVFEKRIENFYLFREDLTDLQHTVLFLLFPSLTILCCLRVSKWAHNKHKIGFVSTRWRRSYKRKIVILSSKPRTFFHSYWKIRLLFIWSIGQVVWRRQINVPFHVL